MRPRCPWGNWHKALNSRALSHFKEGDRVQQSSCATTRMNGDVDSINKISTNIYAKFLLPTHPETPSM